MFAKKSNSKKERANEEESINRPPGADKEDEEDSANAKRVKGLGSEAYWVATKFGGALYVLKGEQFLRISVGGRYDLQTKLRNSTTLARQALSRF